MVNNSSFSICLLLFFILLVLTWHLMVIIERQDVLHVSELPPNMGDPKFAASFSPPIRRACEEFPKLAAAIIKMNGLYPEEFNEYREKLENNIFFRYRVHREVQKITATNK